jgi:hypothetical protein
MSAGTATYPEAPPRTGALPSPLVHALRARSFPRLYRMANAPGKRGFGRALHARIGNIVAQKATLIEKAIALSYVGSYLTDHIVLAESEASRIIDGREMGDQEKHQAWEGIYAKVIASVSSDLPGGDQILNKLSMLENYTRLPALVHRLRGEHWAALNLILRRLSTQSLGEDPA